ncbi:uncharacterized protein Z520_05143 [Fonsecaea multimorphosa CBS 102226]|uniref:Major facilitator superfamily (MFS) profile domain-containing protein n=1 Tax=Fonsecaea multimorphosa CBS 102226 TaxID=1442371 RepID=A0A0D2K178_9EURO|nr:uncharacterized protein Z520_05143 [Fonsecaea multimorphosa CBS 102226]KIX99567.1 hypothetical protein Z520_05143 [Fonsecaea multimorphosa CBS 102226]OAL25558.1 hypothetical protein AYO22_04877 [Fonsecaea multimorphosa]
MWFSFKSRRVYLLATVAYMGSFLFGYDVGVMGSVLAFDSFKEDFGLPTNSSGFASAKAAEISSNVVSLLIAGCFFGALAAAFLNEKFGRRFSLMGFAVVFLLGAALQTGSPRQLSYIYAGRVIAGLGVGSMSSITPVFVAENSPARVRGRITGLFQEFLVLGTTLSYWLDYGVAKNIPKSSKQWRIPLGVQLIPGGILLVGMLFLRESPRWLAKQGRDQEAVAALAHIRCDSPDDVEVMSEFAEIKASIAEEEELSEGVTWKECLQPNMRKRFMIIFFLMLCQQFTGTNSIGYFAPQIFQTVGLSGTDSSLFATGVYGVVKVFATGLFLWWITDRIGRKWPLVVGGIWMATMMFILGAILATHPPNQAHGVSHASIAMVVMIYLYVIGYSLSWGPGPWIYVGEIFPTRTRAYGVALGAATQWLFNFVISKITPAAIHNLGWKTFIMYGVFCLGNAAFAFVFIRETKGRTLEEINGIFGAVDQVRRPDDFECIGVEDKEGTEMNEYKSFANVRAKGD